MMEEEIRGMCYNQGTARIPDKARSLKETRKSPNLEVSEGAEPCQHLASRFLVQGTVRGWISIIWSHLVRGILLLQIRCMKLIHHLSCISLGESPFSQVNPQVQEVLMSSPCFHGGCRTQTWPISLGCDGVARRRDVTQFWPKREDWIPEIPWRLLKHFYFPWMLWYKDVSSGATASILPPWGRQALKEDMCGA